MDSDQFPSFTKTLEAWREEANELPCDKSFPVMYTGVCCEEILFIRRSDGYVRQGRYFRADDGSFISVTVADDVVDRVCGGVRYWPIEFPCGDYVVTEVLCGKSKKVGHKGRFVTRSPRRAERTTGSDDR